MLLKRLDANGWVNVLIVITCAIVLTLTIQRATTSGPLKNPVSAFHAGDHAEAIPGVEYNVARTTIVLYIKSSCPYCTASMPFYERLSAAAARAKARIIAVDSEPTDVLRQYLQQHHVRVDQAVGGFAGRALGTPTLLVVDSRGTIRDAWIGQQPPQKGEEITDAMAKGM